MANAYDVKREVRLQERLANQVAAFAKQPGNSSCADCGATRSVRFVSVTLGTFICNRCYGLHRAIRVHVTRTKCIGLDAWLPVEVQLAGVYVSLIRMAMSRSAWHPDPNMRDLYAGRPLVVSW